MRLAKLQWRIAHDYEELKDELGLDHFEGRGWRGLQHYGTPCIAAYAFFVADRARLFPLPLCLADPDTATQPGSEAAPRRTPHLASGTNPTARNS